jgi:phospholipid transport system substrate-binding protein
MLKKLILAFAFLLFTTSSYAITQSEIKTAMSNKIDKVLLVLKDSKLPTDQKGKEIFSIMGEVFDYKLMSRLALGKKWKQITKYQKDKFTKLFTEKLKKSYIDKLDLYTDELVKILGTKKLKKNRILLNTQLVGKNNKYDINYKFYKVKNKDEWLIYDIEVIGASIIQTYRKQFSGFLKNKPFDELLTHLKTNQK